MFYSCGKSISTKHPVLPIEKVTYECDNVTTPYYQISSLGHYLSSGRLRLVKNKGSFLNFQLQKRQQSLTRGFKYGDLIWKLLVFWKLVAEERCSLTTGRRNRRFHCIFSCQSIFQGALEEIQKNNIKRSISVLGSIEFHLTN